MMDSSDEESIIPILNQISEYGMRKNEQCTSLQSFLNEANARNEKLEKKIETLETAWIKNRNQIKQLDNECTSLKSSLSASDSKRENLDKMLIAARAKNYELEKKVETLLQLHTAAEVEAENRGNQCENLKSLLSTYDIKLENSEKAFNAVNSNLKEVEEKNRNLELGLKSAADACASKCEEFNNENKTLRSKIETLELSLKTSENKCSSLEVSLVEASSMVEGMNTRCNDLNSSFLAMKAEKAELIAKCETLEKSLSTANVKIEQLELQLNESIKENTTNNAKIEQLELQLNESKKQNAANVKLEKEKLIMATLKKVENKLLKNPLYPMIDRMKRNIENLDDMKKNSTPCSEQINDVEIFDVTSSDDDASTLSYTSDRRIDEIELVDGYRNYSQADVFLNISDESQKQVVVTMPASSSSTDFDNLGTTAQNDRANIQVEVIDDSSYDSDISLNVYTNVSTTSIQEEHSYSSEKSSRSSKKSVPVSLESNRSAILVNNSASTPDKKEIEKRVSFHHSVKVSEKKNQPKYSNVPEIDLHLVQEPMPDVLNYEKEINRLQETIEDLIKKTSRNIKLLHPVILLERCEDDNEDDRPDVGFDDSTESESESSPSVLRKRSERRSGLLPVYNF